MKKVLVLAVSLAFTTGLAQAQTDPRVAQLEKRLDALEQQLAEASSSRSSGADAGLPLHGFADVSLGRVSPSGRGSSGAAVGSLDLYLTPQFGDRVKALVELVFEVESDGGLLTDLERVQIGYAFNDAATVWLGRFHTPYGFWNTGFHHGQQIQTAVNRPRFIDFEDKGGILPAHGTGLWLSGGTNTAAGRIGYDYYVTNAPEIAEGETDGQGVLDMKMGGKGGAFSPMNGINLSLRPAALPDLTVGVHALGGKIDYVDDAALATTNAQTIRLRVTGAWAYLQSDNWEAIGEYYRFNNEAVATGAKRTSSAGFAQVGYIVGAFTPYARAEKTSLDQADPYFSLQESGSSYKRSAVGLKYDLNAKAAAKFEGGRTTFTDAGTTQTNFSEARVQLAVRF